MQTEKITPEHVFARAVQTFLASGVVVGLAAMIAWQIVYVHVLVPRLDRFQSVPLYWWLLVFSPVIAAAIAIGVWARTTLDRAVAALGSAVGFSVYFTWAASNAMLGFRNQGFYPENWIDALPAVAGKLVLMFPIFLAMHLLGSRISLWASRAP